MKLKRLKCFIILFVANIGHAKIFSRITKSSGNRTYAIYEFIIGEWEDDDLTPNPCYHQERCYIAINHRHKNGNTHGDSLNVSPTRGNMSSVSNKYILTAPTMGDLGKLFKSRYPFPIFYILMIIGWLWISYELVFLGTFIAADISCPQYGGERS